MATLADAIELIREGDAQIVERQEEANETLASIDKGIKEFLGLQKRPRLDNLEDRRESKRRLSKLGSGLLTAGGAIGGAALALGNDAMGGDRIDPLRMLGGAAVGAALLKFLKKPLVLLGGAIAGVAGLIAEMNTRTKSGLKGVEKMSDARIKQMDDIIAKAQGELNATVEKEAKLKAASEEYQRNKAASAGDPRGDYVAQEGEIKRQQGIAEAERKRRKIQETISSAEQERMQQERIREDARDAQTRKSVAERRKRLTALQAQQAEFAANANDPRGDYTKQEAEARVRQAPEAPKAANVPEAPKAANLIDAPDVVTIAPEAPALPTPANNPTAPRVTSADVPPIGMETAPRMPEAANVPTAPRVAPTTPPVGMEVYDDAILREARKTKATTAVKVPVKPAGQGTLKGIAKGVGKAAGVAAAPIDVAVSIALGGGEEVQTNVTEEGRKTTVNEVAAASAENLIGGLFSFFVDLPANIINAGIDKAGQAITGDENFTVGRTDIGGYVGEKVRAGVEATGIGDETNISGTTAATLVEAKRVITLDNEKQRQSMIQTLEEKKAYYKTAYEAGNLTEEQYTKRINSLDSQIQGLQEGITVNRGIDTRLQEVYAEPTADRVTPAPGSVPAKMEAVQETQGAIQSGPQQNSTVQAVDARTTNNSTSVVVAPTAPLESGGGIESIDPTVRALPGARF